MQEVYIEKTDFCGLRHGAEYAKNFMEYLNRKQNLTFEVQAFTGVKSLLAFAEQNRIEILLISEAAVCRGGTGAGCGKADRPYRRH